MRRAKLLVENGVFFKDVVDRRSQELLNFIADNANKKVMSINAAKTGLMLVSAASRFEARVQVSLAGQIIHGQDTMKLLGVTIDKDATFRMHIDNLSSRLRLRTWALAKLKKKGLSEEKLVRMYCCMIRPVVEYAAPA